MTTATGHCLCGAVAWTYDGRVGAAGYCHCEDCRRCTGSAFNVSVRFERARFRIDSGIVGAYTKRADSGRELTRHFCVACGSPIYTSSPAHADAVYVKAGTFDEPSLVAPVDEAWTRSRVSWSRIAGLPAYERDRGG